MTLVVPKSAKGRILRIRANVKTGNQMISKVVNYLVRTAPPTFDVFARGSAEGRGKAVAVGSVAAPKHVYLRVRSSGYGQRTETTHDEGLAKIPITVELQLGMVGATKCDATASAYSVAPRTVQVTGTHVVELMTRP